MKKKLVVILFLSCVIMTSIISCLITHNSNAAATEESIISLWGKVKKRGKGGNLEKVTVKIKGTEDGKTYKDKTNRRGYYSFFGLPYMEYSLTFRKKGYETVKTNTTENLLREHSYSNSINEDYGLEQKTIYMDKK